MPAGMLGLGLLIITLGVFPGTFLNFLEAVGITGGGEVRLSPAEIYGGEAMLESAVTLMIGFLLFALLRTGGGRRVTTRVSGLRLGVEGSLAVMAFGLLVSVGVFVL